MNVEDHEEFVVTGLEEKVLDIAEKDVLGTYVRRVRPSNHQLAYRSSAFLRGTGIEAHFGGSPPLQVGVYRQGRVV